MLFNEPKLLKCRDRGEAATNGRSFSALQRAEIAEILLPYSPTPATRRFSALQRAEIAEIGSKTTADARRDGFSALQRAEIAEI